MSTILVMGGTGAMGVYLVPELAAMGHQVHVVSLDDAISDNANVKYIKANAKDRSLLRELLRNKYDAIVDFMVYSTIEFADRFEMLLDNTNHYIYLSSYRVYAESVPITEDSPRLLDVSNDTEYLKTDDYSLYKARGENILGASKYSNWTAVRPAITYSKFRYQLVTLEADVAVYRAQKKLPVILPGEALSVQGTMSWAGDVAKMMSRLVLNTAAYREAYTLSTAEHHTWGEIAGYYNELIGLEYVAVDAETYLSFFGSGSAAKYQLYYDRLINRVIDNTKILKVTGMKQTELMPLKEGLAKELSGLPPDTVWRENPLNERMDEFLR